MAPSGGPLVLPITAALSFPVVFHPGELCFCGFFFFFLFFILNYFWLCWIVVAACRLSLVAASGGLL